MENRAYKRIFIILILALNACIIAVAQSELLVAFVSGISLMTMVFICCDVWFMKLNKKKLSIKI